MFVFILESLGIAWDALDKLLTLLRLGIGCGDARLILGLGDDPYTLAEVWDEVTLSDKDLFAEAVGEVTWCSDCDTPTWVDEAVGTHNGTLICESCRDSNYQSCSDCDEVFPDQDMAEIHGGAAVCESCSENSYSRCVICSSLFPDDEVTDVQGDPYCDRRCLPNYCYWCEECDEWDTDSHEHEEEGCDCEAPRPFFTFPANGHGVVCENERLAVELAAGTISDVGMEAVFQAVIRSGIHPDWYQVRKVIDSLDPLWQKKQGNFTRRLSKAMYQHLAVKVPPALMSEIGNLARQHTSDVSSYLVEFTRNLNGSASDFYHEESCWFTGGNYGRSRCALKNWGGLGLRSYQNEDAESCYPSGRAWVQPLNESLNPTHNTTDAHAYVVYNGYGLFEGYAAARIVAHLTGKTYRKVRLGLSPQFVNGDTGYLIADEETCEATESVHYVADEHSKTDHRTLTTTTTPHQEVAA